MKEQIKAEMERHKKFESSLLGVKSKAIKVANIDIRNYAKYILRDGSAFEKRQLLSCLRSRIQMSNGRIQME